MGLPTPGTEVSYRYCGHLYTATVRGHYRISVPQGSRCSGARCSTWMLLGRVEFTTGSGRTHRKEALLAAYTEGRYDDPEADAERAEAVATVRALAAAGHHVTLPRRGRDDYYTAAKAIAAGRKDRLEGK